MTLGTNEKKKQVRNSSSKKRYANEMSENQPTSYTAFQRDVRSLCDNKNDKNNSNEQQIYLSIWILNKR